jgi:N,N'-diacetyllegionaminate synthase
MASQKVIFIAEIGLNHNGNFGLFFELIKQAALAGADFAKFQLGWRAGSGEINQLGDSELELIIKCCDYHGIKPLFSIFNRDAWAQAIKYEFEAYKIASRTVIDDRQLAQDIINSGKRTFVSLGMTDEEAPFGISENVSYLWCKSEYPAYPWQLTDMPKSFSESYQDGYSDHSVGIEVPLMAIIRGATVIEKHFTLDKSDTTIRDHALSASPSEFRNLVQLGNAMKKNLDIGV